MTPGDGGALPECDPAQPTCQPFPGGDATWASVIGFLIVVALALGAMVMAHKMTTAEDPPASEASE